MSKSNGSKKKSSTSKKSEASFQAGRTAKRVEERKKRAKMFDRDPRAGLRVTARL